MIIGITGPSGSGKTTLLELIRAHGGMVLDCDAIYHELLRTDKALLAAIDARFPGVVEDGQLQRKKLGAIVFADKNALQELNAITHGAVKDYVLQQLSSAPNLAAIDAIGLFESGLDKLCKPTVAVIAPEEMRVKRLMARDNITEEYARNRIAAQPANEDFSRLCDITLVNDGTPEIFQEKCLAFLQQQDIIKEKNIKEYPL